MDTPTGLAPDERSETAARLGFHSLRSEVSTTLTVSGTLPSWLSGSLVRNGPGAFELGGATVDHWFDGLAMVRRFAFEDGRVRYRNRFLRSDTYWRARAGRFDGGFATGTSTLRDRLVGVLLGSGYDNANVTVERVGDRYLALTETPERVEIDPRTLATIGPARYEGSAPSGQVSCAHVRRDPATDAVVGLDTAFGRSNTYHVYESHAPDDRRHVSTVPVDRPAYMHSFALTPSYVVLTEFPFTLDPTTFLSPGRIDGFVDAYDWQPGRGTRFTVVDRASGEVLARPTTDAFFGFHHVNAYETGLDGASGDATGRDRAGVGDGDGRTTGGDVVIHLETVPDAESIGALGLDRLRAGAVDAVSGRIERFRLSDPAAGVVRIDREMVYDDGTALPTAARSRWLRPHRYVYAQSTGQPVTDWPRGILKLDVETGDVREFDEEDYRAAGRDGDGPAGGRDVAAAGGGAVYFGEPIFVPRPGSEAGDDDASAGGDREDDGVLVSVALDVAAGRSVLVVIDATTMSELARAPLPHALPFGFHGRWFPEL
jgi:beta-carotene 15,15'-monooxygenase